MPRTRRLDHVGITVIRPDHQPGSPAAMATELGLRSLAFEADDLHAIVERVAKDCYGLIGG